MTGKEITNPAFSRLHPTLPIVYTCTEDVSENGEVLTYKISSNGKLTQLCDPIDAGGTSTCYITLTEDNTKMITANYWNSNLVTLPVDVDSGVVSPSIATYDPKEGKAMRAKSDAHVNHSKNDSSTIAERQADPHSHAIVLDPYHGCIAYVPDLGMDLIRQFYFDASTGELTPLSQIKSGLATGMPDGPRYMEFHPSLPICYVINELSSSVAVFSINKDAIDKVARATRNGEPLSEEHKTLQTMTMIQNIDTVPDAFPRELNTCGRICCHPTGRFVFVSNRGHDSIAILKVHNGKGGGRLSQVGFFHTRGDTPRHFQFDASGQWLVVANQDSDCISVFKLNLSTGELKYTGNSYSCPSPNFVCNVPKVPEPNVEEIFGINGIDIAGVTKRTSSVDEQEVEKLQIELEMAREEIKKLRDSMEVRAM